MNKNKKPKTKPVGSAHDLAAEDSDDTGSRALRLEITRINLYERNPRRSKNPEYDRIKASILRSGMDQGLLVTQRPGDKNYIVQAGGNTRLQILKELFEATGDERFFWVECLFVEWDRQSSDLVVRCAGGVLRDQPRGDRRSSLCCRYANL
jgi:ParB family protein of integrating conjugative element (PFGI_1 class)